MTDQKHIWLDHYPSGVDWAMEIAEKPVFSMLQDTVERFPSHPAFDFLGKKYTWSDIHEAAQKLAKGLAGFGR